MAAKNVKFVSHKEDIAVHQQIPMWDEEAFR